MSFIPLTQSSVATIHTLEDNPPLFSPIFRAFVSDIPVDVLIDTGSPVCVVSLATLTRLGISPTLSPSPCALKAVNGNALLVLGEIELSLSIQRRIFKHKFIVIAKSSIRGDLLLGYEFLMTHQFDICPSAGILSGQDITIPLLSDTFSDDSNQLCAPLTWTPETSVAHAVVVRDVTLPPCTACLVSVKVSRPGCTALLSPEGVRVKGLVVEPALYSVYNRYTRLRLINASTMSISLKRSTRVVDLDLSDQPMVDVPLPEHLCALSYSPPSSPLQLHDIPDVSIPGCKPVLLDILREFREVLPSPERPLGRSSLLQHRIELEPDARPSYVPAYRLPHSKRQAADDITHDLLSHDIIEPSYSPWNSPLLLVPKKDGTFRPVIDYRKLNSKTVPDRFPLPVLQDLLHDVGTGHSIFSTIDLTQGFYQVEMAPESRPLTAFSTPSGHWQFRRMPFGLRNSPITFSRLMSVAMAGLVGPTVLLYLDDLIIASRTVEEHKRKLSLVLERLRSAGLTINLKKCKFFQTEINFLGHLINSEGLQPINNKVDAILSFPEPRNVREVKSFLGLAGFYRSFMKNFSMIAAPLTSLLRKNAQFCWNTVTQEAFDKLKLLLTQAPVRVFPNYSLPFELVTDASKSGLGAVLMQYHGKKMKPIAFASRKTNVAESRYSATDLESLAVVWALKHFKEIIHGYEINVHTDHQPLVYLLNDNGNQKGRAARWLATLLDFSPKIRYTPGSTNYVADALSRCHAVTVSPIDASTNAPAHPTSHSELHSLDQDELRLAQRADDHYKLIIDALEKNRVDQSQKDRRLTKDFFLNNGILYHHSAPSRRSRQRRTYTQLVIPDTLVNRVLFLLHEAPAAAHQGLDKAIKFARTKYHFKRQAQRITTHIKSCQLCPFYKGHVISPHPILTYDIPERPFQRVSIDVLSGFLPTVSGNRYILVCIDNFTRYCELVPIPDKSAVTIARAFNAHILCRHDTPVELMSDNGTEFVNDVLRSLCSLMNIKHINVLPYRPQANGITERLNRSILNCMRLTFSHSDQYWDEKLPDLQAALNSSFHGALGDIPHFLVYGMDRRLPYEFLNEDPVPLYSTDFVPTLLKRKQQLYAIAREHLQVEKDAMLRGQHKLARRVDIDVGVLVFRKIRVREAPMPKLARVFKGPFRVISVKNNKALLRNLQTHEETWSHFDMLKLATQEYTDRYIESHPDVISPLPSHNAADVPPPPPPTPPSPDSSAGQPKFKVRKSRRVSRSALSHKRPC